MPLIYVYGKSLLLTILTESVELQRVIFHDKTGFRSNLRL